MALSCPTTNPHFFEPLLPGFTKNLEIPLAFFLKHLDKSNKGKTAKLRSDASEKTWKVKLDGRRFSDGWEYFAVAHDLRVGDIVVFRHEGELVFHVTALGPSCCEIQYGEDSEEDDKMEKVCDTAEEISRKKKRPKTEIDSSTDQSCFVIKVTASNLRRDIVYLPKAFAVLNGLMKKFEIVLMIEERETWKLYLTQESYSGRFYMSKGWRSFCLAKGKKPGDIFNFKLIRNDETPVLKLFPLNLQKLEPSNDTRQGLEATEKEFLGVETNRDDSRQGSCFRVNNNDYFPCVEPTNEAIRKGKCLEANQTTIKEENITTTSNRFVKLILTTTKLDLPLEFTKGNGIKKAETIKMIDRYGTKWSTSLLMNKKKRGAMRLGRGSKGFCEVNGINMGESFVLELVWEDTVPVLKFCSKC